MAASFSEWVRNLGDAVLASNLTIGAPKDGDGVVLCRSDGTDLATLRPSEDGSDTSQCIVVKDNRSWAATSIEAALSRLEVLAQLEAFADKFRSACRLESDHLMLKARAGDFVWVTVDASRYSTDSTVRLSGEGPTDAVRGTLAKLDSSTLRSCLAGLEALCSVAAAGGEGTGGGEEDDDEEEERTGCGICYAAVKTTSPSSAVTTTAAAAAAGGVVVCSNCRVRFHPSCIGEWLRAQTQSRRAFAAVIGPCPYCSADITA